MTQSTTGPARPPSAEEILAALDPEQRAVAQALTGPVCVLAGAGTGKTRAITHRIAYGVRTNTYDPASVLAVTFTARAAGEMRTRLRTLGVQGVQARTFHAAALRQLAYFLPRAESRAVPRLLEHKAPAVAQAAARLGLEVDKAAVRDLAAEIEWAKVNLLTPDAYQRQAATRGREPAAGHDIITVARLLAVYDEVLAESDAMDFEDVLLITAGLLASHDDVADHVRRQYRHFVIDEYQDVSPLQQRLLDLWLGPRHEVCVVGDANQTIYSFTGADATFLTSFPRRYPTAAVIHLVRDYRSTPQVVSLANSVRGTSGRGHDLVAQRPSGPAPQFTTYPDDEAEARGIAAQIKGLIGDGFAAEEIAVLVRTNAQTEPFERSLAEVGLRYVLRGGERFFARPEVREAMRLLRAAAIAPSDKPLGEMVRDVLTGAGWGPQAPAGRGAQRERWESLEALAALADELAAGGVQLPQFVVELDERAQAQHAPSVGGVTIASLHAAKGLEWDAVFLAGLSDGLMPIALAEGREEIAEEQRLLYVGITRAREVLCLSYGAARGAGGRAIRKPSRFLTKFWPSAESRSRSRDRAGASSEPRGPAQLDPEQLATFEVLRQWRAERARALDRPAFAVLPDVALLLIAQRRPSSIAELAAIRGIGPAKLESFGAEILQCVAQSSGSAEITSA